MNESDRERAYYRAVEDLFAHLRGTVHVLSPRDFQILRGWWRDGVPLAAVTAGIVEAFTKKKERDGEDPVVSLAYCRHAVKRHARRMAEGMVGREGSPGTPGSADEELSLLAEELGRAVERQAEARPGVARVLDSIRTRLALLSGGDRTSVETGLFALEEALLEECWEALDPEDRAAVHEAAARVAGGDGGTRRRSYLAHRDRELRRLLGLPRLELA